jgi:hypothetical protein
MKWQSGDCAERDLPRGEIEALSRWQMLLAAASAAMAAILAAVNL